MYNRKWDVPVVVLLPAVGAVTVSATRDAADCLMEQWPPDHSDAFDEALRVCLEVYEGNLQPEDARQAFILAAAFAKIPAFFSLNGEAKD